MDVILLGSGNTATVLGRLMLLKGYRILQVWSRNLQHAQALAQELKANAVSNLNQLSSGTGICVLAVSDEAIAPVAAQLSLKEKLLVHTAGSVSIQVLKNAANNYGVLYPLQSLRREIDQIPEIPFLIDGNTGDVKVILNEIAQTLSGSVSFANDEQRMQMHLAAVTVNNFTNHLYAIAEQFCKKHHLNFQLLHPLIQETAERLQQGTADSFQTGPARRNDLATIEKHLTLLQNEPQLQLLYKTLSNSILNQYHKKEELS
jgi:predicted short-subunit dehydrogenase-like oxidoreductase (DUF2520 family)